MDTASLASSETSASLASLASPASSSVGGLDAVLKDRSDQNRQLTVTELSAVRGYVTLFQHLNLSLHAGECCYVTGENGAGKTTFLRMLIGLTQPETGVVRWQGVPIQENLPALHADLCYIGHHNALKEEMTPIENMMVLGLSADAANRALADAGLAGRSTLPCKFLSQGQRRRVALARLVAQSDRCLWILDEPLVALDQRASAWLIDIFERHLANGGLLVITSHQVLPLSKYRNLNISRNMSA